MECFLGRKQRWGFSVSASEQDNRCNNSLALKHSVTEQVATSLLDAVNSIGTGSTLRTTALEDYGIGPTYNGRLVVKHDKKQPFGQNRNRPRSGTVRTVPDSTAAGEYVPASEDVHTLER